MVFYQDAVQDAAIDHRFSNESKPLDADQCRRLGALREDARVLARHIAAATPPSWERDEALRALDNACSWAARAIVRHE